MGLIFAPDPALDLSSKVRPDNDANLHCTLELAQNRVSVIFKILSSFIEDRKFARRMRMDRYLDDFALFESIRVSDKL